MSDFFQFITNIHDVDTAFAFYAMSGKEVDSKKMHSVAKNVCGIELTENTIDLIFTLFDDDDSKTLNRRLVLNFCKYHCHNFDHVRVMQNKFVS